MDITVPDTSLDVPQGVAICLEMVPAASLLRAKLCTFLGSKLKAV